MHATERSNGRWLAYVAPIFAYILLAHGAKLASDPLRPWALGATAAIPALLLVHFARRGSYPELRKAPGSPAAIGLDVLVGLGSAALWVVPYLLFDFDFGPGFEFLAPDRSVGPGPYGADGARAALLIALRLAGAALIVPIVEELFIRSFVMRFVQGEERETEFHKLPIARYTRLSFWITAVVFTLGHRPWEWWVALPWFVVTTLWFFRRRSIASVIIVHAAANAALFGFVLLVSHRLTDGAGNPIPLWYFL